MKRHPEISQPVAEGISKSRAVVTEQALRLWFKDLKLHLEKEKCVDILDDPSRIFNGDEIAFQLCPRTGKVLCPKKWKNVYEVNVGQEKETITVLLFISAEGKVLPPLIVYPYVRLPAAIADSVPQEWVIGSPSGWMRSETFFEYMANSFNDWLITNNIKNPILCLLDGHKSHLTMQLSEFCSANGIILYSLLPNSTHIIQRADVNVFKPLKSNWRKTVLEWKSEPDNFNKSLTKENFAPLVKMTLDKGDLQSSVINGFRACGLYPYDPNNVDYSKCVQNVAEKLNNIQIATKEDNIRYNFFMFFSFLDFLYVTDNQTPEDDDNYDRIQPLSLPDDLSQDDFIDYSNSIFITEEESREINKISSEEEYEPLQQYETGIIILHKIR